MAERILFCGGGTMGHLAPALAVYEEVKKKVQIEAFFICDNRRQEGDELRRLALRFAAISAPKFPRGFSLSWCSFWILFPVAFFRAYFIIAAERPRLIFSKGGFISVPVCLAGVLQRIPIILHESDATIGLANRVVALLSKKVCRGFPGSALSPKEIFTGNPLRKIITAAEAPNGLQLTNFSGARPIIMVIGGSQGAEALNNAVDASLYSLLQMADVIHLTGTGKIGERRSGASYFVREYSTDELPALYRISTIVVTRGGAGTLNEIAYFRKPAVIVPIAGLANDHQVHNAKILTDHAAALSLPELQLDRLTNILSSLIKDPKKCLALGLNLHSLFPEDAAQRIAAVLLDELSKSR